MAPQPRLRRSGRRFDELRSLLLVETSLSNIHKRQSHHCRRHWPFLGMEAESEPREGLPAYGALPARSIHPQPDLGMSILGMLKLLQ